jgi:hypothetical protein
LFEVAQVVRLCGQELSRGGALSDEQNKVLRALMRCRTAQLGGHLDVCDSCGHERPAYNSCRNRHCPKCQALAQERWLRARRERILPVHHFHVVFTLPSELRALVKHNPRRLYELLLQTGPATLLGLARDPRWLGADIGLTAVLHTWRRDLAFHPHLHCVVTGGGLDPEGNWHATRPGYLFPVRVLGKLFRGKFLDALRRLYARGLLQLPDELSEPGAFGRMLDRLYEKSWLVYAKPPFGGAGAVYAYLGRYTHRIGVSNARLLNVTEQAVTLRTRGQASVSMPPRVFVARFLQHVLPHGLVRIRHCGLLASGNVHTRLAKARRALEASCAATVPVGVEPGAEHCDDKPDFVRLYRQLTGIDLSLCPRCDGVLRRLPLPPTSHPRAPP